MSAIEKSGLWLSVVGIGEDGLNGLTATARQLVEDAAHLVGGDRHLAMIPQSHKARRHPWASPLSETVKALKALEGQNVCVLATGDPMSFGIGVTLARAFGCEAMTIIPVPGAFSLAAAKLAWPLEGVVRLTLHGRPFDLVRLHLHPCARLLILSEDGSTPGKLAALLNESGYSDSNITVLEHLGGELENIRSARANDTAFFNEGFQDLNLLAVECHASSKARILSRVPGLPDEAFLHDGQLTKREVRAATLAALAPQPGEFLWDIGCGNGSIAIEWMRAGGRAVGIEPNLQRRDRAVRNAITLGVPELSIVDGVAPDVLKDLEPPNAVFVGGGSGDGAVLEAAWQSLLPGGRLVANAVTVESEQRLAAFHATHGGDMSRISVSRLVPVGPHHGWRPMMPVTQLSITKPYNINTESQE